MSKLIFGCGYLGSRVAALWRDAGHEVTIVTRTAERATGFKQLGYRAIVADVARPETLCDLPTAETVLYAVGYDRSSTDGPSISDVYAGGVRNVLQALAGGEPSPGPSLTARRNATRFIYISSTGVYGKGSGEWIDEATPPDPQREGGRASLAAEQVLSSHPIGSHGIILRLAGIYGPGRVPFLDILRNAEPIPARATGFLNLIHVDDAAAVVVAAATIDLGQDGSISGARLSSQAPHIYCVSDGNPVARHDYYGEVARQIGAPPPRFVEPAADSPRALRAESNRRVCNKRMLAELRVTLTYPNYQAGLAAILSS